MALHGQKHVRGASTYVTVDSRAFPHVSTDWPWETTGHGKSLPDDCTAASSFPSHGLHCCTKVACASSFAFCARMVSFAQGTALPVIVASWLGDESATWPRHRKMICMHPCARQSGGMTQVLERMGSSWIGISWLQEVAVNGCRACHWHISGHGRYIGRPSRLL